MFSARFAMLLKPWLVYTGLAAMVLFRVFIYLQAEPQISGDAHSYLNKAEYVATTGKLPPLSVQPVGYPLVLSLLLDSDPKETARTVGRIQQAMDLLAVLTLVLLAKSQLGGRHPMAFLVLSSVLILQPFTGTMSGSLYTEQMVSFFSFFGVLSLSIGLSCAWGSALICLGGLLLGLAGVLRVDVLLLNTVILGVFIGLAWLKPTGNRLLRTSALLISFLLLPISIAAMQYNSTNEVGLVKKEFHYGGYMSWLRTWPADRTEYANFAFFSNWGGAEIDSYPNKAFADGSEKEAVSALLSTWVNSGYAENVDHDFHKIAQKKREAAVIRYFLLNPLYRMTHFWINIDGGQFYLATLDIKRPISTLLVGLILALRVVLLTAFVFGAAAVTKHLIRRKSLPEFDWITTLATVSVLYVIGRTAELGLLGLFSWGGLMEVRYVIVAFPFFLFVCAIGVRMLLDKAKKLQP